MLEKYERIICKLKCRIDVFKENAKEFAKSYRGLSYEEEVKPEGAKLREKVRPPRI